MYICLTCNYITFQSNIQDIYNLRPPGIPPGSLRGSQLICHLHSSAGEPVYLDKALKQRETWRIDI